MGSIPNSWQNFVEDGWPITCGATLVPFILLLFAERYCVPSSDVKSYLAPLSAVWWQWGKRLSVFSFDTRGIRASTAVWLYLNGPLNGMP